MSSIEYEYRSADPTHDDRFLWNVVASEMRQRVGACASVFEIGCGNGVNARRLSALGKYDITATDPSHSAIDAARSVASGVRFEVASVYDPLAERFGTFDAVIALEVIEHLYTPDALPKAAFQLLKPGGFAFFSTPYHGWLKNVAIAALGRFDAHVDPLWEHGHIKFFSPSTLRTILQGAGFELKDLHRLGRIPPLARSMLAIAQRPYR